jgi:hypothetical protein
MAPDFAGGRGHLGHLPGGSRRRTTQRRDLCSSGAGVRPTTWEPCYGKRSSRVTLLAEKVHGIFQRLGSRIRLLPPL